jgi:hypothetical protein
MAVGRLLPTRELLHRGRSHHPKRFPEERFQFSALPPTFRDHEGEWLTFLAHWLLLEHPSINQDNCLFYLGYRTVAPHSGANGGLRPTAGDRFSSSHRVFFGFDPL